MIQVKQVTFSDEVIMPLNEKDTRAVDWLMNQRNNPSPASSADPVGDDASYARRMGQVNAIFTLLELMPEDTPPAGLAERTLARLRAQARAEVAAQPTSVPSQPNA